MLSKSKFLAETVVLIVAASAIGLIANTIGPRAIKLSRDYFPSGRPAPTAPQTTRPATTTDPQADTGDDSDPPEAQDSPAIEHGLQPAGSEKALKWFKDMPTSDGLVVFVDARPDLEYEEGHIPGALHVDHYRQDEYLPAVMDRLEAAQVIVVYCNGGDCEDSIFLSNDLIYEHGLPYEHVFLYEGGMKDWNAKGRPVRKGDAP